MAKNDKASKIPKRRNRSIPATKHRVPVDDGDRGRPNPTRVGMKVIQEINDTVLALMEPTQSTSAPEVIRKAVRLLQSVLLCQQTGGKVYFQAANGDFERVVIL